MKRAFAVMALGLLVVGGPAFASAELAKQKNCLACHAVDKKLVGPAYKDIAAKYKSRQKRSGRAGQEDPRRRRR